MIIAAEAMAIAWRRLADVPTADARPWLIVTARNLLLAESRSEPETGRQPLGDIDLEAPTEQLPTELDLGPDLARGLRVLSVNDREALLLIAWDDLTPALAAASLGISPTAFRVRAATPARRRLSDLLTKPR
jgi:RNA polymerase sigma-70 factor (ECF subfamily)